MANLKIPDRHKDGLLKIQKLDAEAVQNLQAAIKKASSPSGLNEASLISSISEIQLEDPKLIGETINALYVVKATKDVSVQEFVDDVCDAMGDRADRDKLTTNLLALLSIEEVGLAAKALDLQTEDERTFCTVSRILTDLRPVFGVDVTEGPKAMVIVHLLKLGYHQAGSSNHRDVYVSMDANDLQTLRKMIDRAEEKAKSLKATIINFDYLANS